MRTHIHTHAHTHTRTRTYTHMGKSPSSWNKYIMYCSAILCRNYHPQRNNQDGCRNFRKCGQSFQSHLQMNQSNPQTDSNTQCTCYKGKCVLLQAIKAVKLVAVKIGITSYFRTLYLLPGSWSSIIEKLCVLSLKSLVHIYLESRHNIA